MPLEMMPQEGSATLYIVGFHVVPAHGFYGCVCFALSLCVCVCVCVCVYDRRHIHGEKCSEAVVQLSPRNHHQMISHLLDTPTYQKHTVHVHIRCDIICNAEFEVKLS